MPEKLQPISDYWQAKDELMEGYSKKQVGSSAMPYKRNPIHCERVCGIAKFVIGLQTTSLTIASEQWLERSLDDSSARRLILPEVFMSINNILDLMTDVINGLYINYRAIDKNLQSKLPYLLMERVLMLCVKNGGDRQDIHEQLRQMSAAPNFMDDMRVLAKSYGVDETNLTAASITGRALEQTQEFCDTIISRIKYMLEEIDKCHSKP
jgi:adenylosuccinate lyase